MPDPSVKTPLLVSLLLLVLATVAFIATGLALASQDIVAATVSSTAGACFLIAALYRVARTNWVDLDQG